MGLRQAILKAARPLAQFVIEAGRYSSSAWPRFFSPGSRTDYSQKAGEVFDNSVVFIALNWIQRNWADAPVVVERQQSDGTWKIDHKHQFVADWGEPNPWYSDDTLNDGLLTSLVATGNAYVAVLRRNNGRPAFVYLPHHCVKVIGGNGKNLVEAYEYTPPGSGATVTLKPDEVIHFRVGNDLKDQKKGLSPLAALLRDIVADNAGTAYSVALLDQMGVPGMVFTPDASATQRPAAEQLRWMKEQIESVFSTDGAGKMLVMPFPGKLETPGGGPEKLALDKLRSVPTSRILAALGLSDIGLGLPSESKTYDNIGQAREMQWEECLLPLKSRIAKTLTAFLRSWYGEGENVRVSWDYSRVRALQPDLDKLFERICRAYTAGLIKRSEGKAEIGFAFDTDDEVYSTDAVLGIDGPTKNAIKGAMALANGRRRLLESPSTGSDE